MKYLMIFMFFLNTFVPFSYAQYSEPTSCEERFSLEPGVKCTPCQQMLHTYSITIYSSAILPPSDQCLVINTFYYYKRKSKSSEPKTLDDAMDKGCSGTASCSESYSIDVAIQVDKTCSDELTKYQSNNTYNTWGEKAEPIIYYFYLAIPYRGFLCSNEGRGKLFFN